MKPFLKWAGNKTQIKDIIKKYIQTDKRFIEPFAGSCAISLSIDAKDYLICDTNQDLINLYTTILKKQDFIEYAESFFIKENNKKEKYYELRETFNNSNNKILKSALFIYLNKHTYNGLCRYNQKGQFNTPFGSYVKPYFPKKEMLFFKKKFSNATFKIQDFRQTMQQAQKGDIVYCDPPYSPISQTTNFTTYTKNGFSIKDQQDLMHWAEKLRTNDIKVIISNHDTQDTRELYKTANIIDEFKVQRYISCTGEKRQKVGELIAVYEQ